MSKKQTNLELEFLNCLNRQWNLFAMVAKVGEHEKEITEYIELKDALHELLSKIAKEK